MGHIELVVDAGGGGGEFPRADGDGTPSRSDPDGEVDAGTAEGRLPGAAEAESPARLKRVDFAVGESTEAACDATEGAGAAARSFGIRRKVGARESFVDDGARRDAGSDREVAVAPRDEPDADDPVCEGLLAVRDDPCLLVSGDSDLTDGDEVRADE
jgi:hypothetical protein